MFAELKRKEDIQKSINEYLGENLDSEDTRRIEFYRIYNNVPVEVFGEGHITAYHKVEYNNDIKMRVLHCGRCIIPEICFEYIQEDMFEPGQWKRHYRSGTKVSSGFVSSCCDMWSQRYSRFCPDCGRMMKSYIED